MSEPSMKIEWEKAEIEAVIPVKDGTGAITGFTTVKVSGLRGTFDQSIELKNGETLSFETPIIVEDECEDSVTLSLGETCQTQEEYDAVIELEEI